MTQRLREKNFSKGVYQAIFLDESQDLTAPQADYLRYLLSKDTDCAFFCGDNAQNIFGKKKLTWKDHGFRFKGRTSTMELSCNFRNTKQIFDFGFEFIKDQYGDLSSDKNGLSETTAHPYKNVVCKRNGPKPLLKEYASKEDEQLAIIKEITRLVKLEKVPPGSIAILHPYATPKYQDLIDPYLQGLKYEGVPVYWLTKDAKSKSDYDPDNNITTISTPFSGKGLEWDIVFMPSLNHYYGDNPDNLRAVAAWRARHILYPSISP